MGNILVVEDQALSREHISILLKKFFPEDIVISRIYIEDAVTSLNDYQVDLLVVDLGLPLRLGDDHKIENGIDFLQTCMKKYSKLNILVQTVEPKTLVRLKHKITNHRGGFAVYDKASPLEELKKKVEWAKDGGLDIRAVKNWHDAITLEPKWLRILELASGERCLQDKEIASEINQSIPYVLQSWRSIRNALGVYPETEDQKKNLRVLTIEIARKKGII